MRARQIQRRDEDLKKTTLFLQKCRMKEKNIFDVTRQIRFTFLKRETTILFHDIKLDNIHIEKLFYK